jgi:hypothetical protein
MQVKKDQIAKETAERLPVTTTDVSGSSSRKEPAGEATMHVKENKTKPVDYLQKASSSGVHEGYAADCGSIDELPSEIANASGARQHPGALPPRTGAA